jgi:hypothetical protein
MSAFNGIHLLFHRILMLQNITLRAARLIATLSLEISRCITLHSTGYVRATLGTVLQESVMFHY